MEMRELERKMGELNPILAGLFPGRAQGERSGGSYQTEDSAAGANHEQERLEKP